MRHMPVILHLACFTHELFRSDTNGNYFDNIVEGMEMLLLVLMDYTF